MIPQDAVDLVVTSDIFTTSHDTWVEVNGAFFKIEIVRKTASGVCWKWPVGKTFDDATDDGTAQYVELSTLECTRILNEIKRRLVQ